MTTQHILDSIRDSAQGKFERIHYTTRKDINNIERSFGIQGNKRHDDDATSVNLWVAEMAQKEHESPVFLQTARAENG